MLCYRNIFVKFNKNLFFRTTTKSKQTSKTQNLVMRKPEPL